ncbi:hypothetical protein F5Y03DRAFT_401821 [Xylaria venustula]|nr:hypothetical protein F5Y03DRAFT_401821 [Xylaria venustula]
MSPIRRAELIAPIVISIFNVAVAIVTASIAIWKPSAQSSPDNLQLITVIWVSRAMQFWVALAAILLYTAPIPIERSFVVVGAGILGNMYNDWTRQLEIFRFILMAPSKNALIVFRVCFGISIACAILFVPDLILSPGKWPKIALILVCAVHRLFITVPILVYRGKPLTRPENLFWGGGNALGSAIQFLGLLLEPFECRLFLYAASSVFGVIAQIPVAVRIDGASPTNTTSNIPRPNENKSTASLEANTLPLPSRFSFDSEMPSNRMPQWVSNTINYDRYFRRG